MFLALKEMRRAKVRFGLLVAAVALLVFLILFQQSTQNALLRAFVGAIENQTAPVLVYSVDGQRVIQGSIITPDLRAAAESAVGGGQVATLAQGSFAATAAGELTDVSVIGFERADVGGPADVTDGRMPTAPGEAIASDVDVELGFGIGDTVRIEPGGYELTVVGLARGIQLNAGPTVFTTLDTYAQVLAARNPDASGPPIANVLAVRPAAGQSAAAVVEAINAAHPDLDALTRENAATATPGVSQVKASFSIIFLLYAIVVPLVIGLFFLIVTFQKASALTLLRAIGASAKRLINSLLVQVMIVLTLGFIVGVLLYTPLSQQKLGSIPLQFETRAVVVWAILLIGLGVLASLVAARRVLRIEPIEATTGAMAGR